MKLDTLLKQDAIIDLSFFNFSNAVTAAYFATPNLEILRVNKNFKNFFPVLNNVDHVFFPSVLKQLGVPKKQIDSFQSILEKEGRVIIPRIEIEINGEIKIFSLLSAHTKNQDFPYLNGVQGQFVDRTIEHQLRKEKEDLLDQKLKDQQTIEEKSKKLENIANRLSKYLTPQLYKSIFQSEENNSAEIKHTRKNLSIFFSDIVSFTDISDQLEPEKLAEIINSYLSEMTNIAISCDVAIDKFIGDAILAARGQFDSDGERNDALNVIEMAIQMKFRIKEMQPYWIKLGLKDGLHVRMGISTGYCTVGNFGSNQKLEFTALGNPINLASRLQSKAPSNEILISDITYNLVKDEVNCEYFDEFTPKGFTRPVKIFRVIDFKSESHNNKRKIFSHKGNFVDVNIFDTSDIDAAIDELKNIQENFKKEK